jgi:hypothetical protein
LYENRIFPFNINMLRNHVFVGAIHELPLPGDPISTNFMNMELRFMNMKLRFVNMKLRFHHSLCLPRAWGFIGYLSAPCQSLEEAKTIFEFCQWQHESRGGSACPPKNFRIKGTVAIVISLL